MKNIIIGTAGHIDHGKTTLIKALTGRETDTLKEEKKRGISINLGFTYFDLPSETRVGIVDVPGHEKFIKNMLAGAAGIDIVLLVIAYDEGIMPQTVEHLDILNYLNVQKGIIVLTKCKNVDNEFKELVKEDILDKFKGTFLENSRMVEVDSLSGYGIDTLIKEIEIMSDEIENKYEDLPPRLNIDRVFSIKGFGTVVTGTLIEGKINLEDDLEIYPKGLNAKIRGIQVHGENVNTVYAGQRAAINISNLKVEDINRGDVLAGINSLEESNMLDVKISLVNHTNKNLKHWDRLKLYHGTKEILCRAVPLEVESLEKGNNAFVQLRLEEGIVAKKGDRFVIRTYSPMETIGGGVIIDTSVKKHKKFDNKIIDTLKIKEKGDYKDIIKEYLKHHSEKYATLKDLMTYTGIHESSIIEEVKKLIEEKNVISLNEYYFYKEQYENLIDDLTSILDDYHKKNRLRDGISKEELRSRLSFKLKNKDIDLLISNLQECNLIKIEDNNIALKTFSVTLNEKQKLIKSEIKNVVKKSGLESILSKDDICNKNKYYEEVLDYMIGKDIELLGSNYILDIKSYELAKTYLINYLNDNKSITLSDYRDLINSSRKNCLIILEHFDRNRITKRIEDKRVLY